MEIYVTLSCSYSGSDKAVEYVGTDREKAYLYSKTDAKKGWFVWVETWIDGKKIKSENI